MKSIMIKIETNMLVETEDFGIYDLYIEGDHSGRYRIDKKGIEEI